MKTEVIWATTSGGANVLRLTEQTLSSPGPGEVRVAIEACGVAYADIMIRLGLVKSCKPPCVLGYDFVGVVEVVGDEVEHHRVGDRVAGITTTGSYARHCNVSAEWLVGVPPEVDAAIVVAGVLNGLTAWQMFFRQACPEPGEWVLVHGAGGGVGTLLLDLAQRNAVKAIGTASPSKHQLIRERGGFPVDYRREDFVAAARDRSEGGVVAAFDHIGGRHMKQSLRALRDGGTVVSYGAYDVARGGRFRPLTALGLRMGSFVDAFALLSGSKSLAHYNVDKWRDQRTFAYRKDLGEVVAALARGGLSPEVGIKMSLAEAAEAHRLLEARSTQGKIVLLA